jgi:hypothetical protein
MMLEHTLQRRFYSLRKYFLINHSNIMVMGGGGTTNGGPYHPIFSTITHARYIG